LAFPCACVCISIAGMFVRCIFEIFFGHSQTSWALRAVEARDGGHGSGWNIAGVLSDSIEIQSPLCIFAPVRDRDPKDHNLLMIFR
jgi:hypothetical protein